MRVNKVNNIKTNLHEKEAKSINKRDGLLFETGNNPEGKVYTNEAVKILFDKLLNYPENVSILEAAEIMFPDEQITVISKESLQTLSLYDGAENISETLELKGDNGNSFYFVKYKNGTTQILFPDDTSTVKEHNNVGSNEYSYSGGVLQKIALERINDKGQQSVSEYKVNEDGYFVGYAQEGETIQDVLKNLGIEENSPEAQQFMELNKANIKSFNRGKVTSFIVGREMLILPENAISGMKYLYTSPINERNKFADKAFDNVNIDFLSTYKEKLEANTSWWELSKQNLINNHKIKNPTAEQINQNMLVLQKLNGKDKKLTQGEEITLTWPIEKNVSEKYQCQNYTLENLRKTYPADKFNISVSDDGNSVTVTDKNGKRITDIEYMTDYTGNHEKYYTGLTSIKYDDLGREKEQIDISPYNLFTGLYKTKTYEYKNTPHGIECSIYEDGELTEVRLYKDYDDFKNGSKSLLNIKVDPDGRRYSIKDDIQVHYDDNNKIIYTINETTAKRTSPTADKLHNALKTKNKEEFENILLSAIDNKHFDKIYDAYKDTYNRDLLSDIEKSSFSKTDKNKFMKIIKNFIDTKTPLNLPKNTDKYNFVYEDNVLTIKNLKKNTVHKIDFNTRFIDFSYEEERKIIQTIFEMPPEAVEDLSIENKKIVRYEGEDVEAGAYSPLFDQISIDPETLTVDVLLHELGHAIDCDGHIFGKVFSSEKEFKELFEKNIDKYEKEGHTRFNWNENYNNSKDVIYETLNEKELWAKCYQYIMLSLIDRDINENDKIFVKYFGENIELAKKMLAQIRELPDEERF